MKKVFSYIILFIIIISVFFIVLNTFFFIFDKIFLPERNFEVIGNEDHSDFFTIFDHSKSKRSFFNIYYDYLTYFKREKYFIIKDKLINNIAIHKRDKDELIINNFQIEVYNKNKLLKTEKYYYSSFYATHATSAIFQSKNIVFPVNFENSSDSVYLISVVDLYNENIKLNSVLNIKIILDYTFNGEKNNIELKLKIKQEKAD